MQKHVVIIGGGLSGKKVAEGLAGAAKITIVQAEDFVEWQIAGTMSLTRPEETFLKAVAPLGPNKLAGVSYVVGKVTDLQEDHGAGYVILEDRKVLHFDFCVLAIGFAMGAVKPQLGASFDGRREEVRKFSAAIRNARAVAICGGGPVGVELAGDVREVVPKGTKVVLVGRVLPGSPEKMQRKVASKLRELGIELMEDDALILDEALRNGSTTPGSYKLKGGGSVEADVLLPAFGTRQSGFLADLRGVLDPQGNVVVNEYMQCPAAPRLFAVGCTNLPEFAGMPKIESQAKTAVANLKLCLQGKTCAQKHKEGAPFMKAPPMTIVGHDTFAFMDTTNMPPPVACCAWVGFPCCPPPVCWCCLGPFCCGGPCQDPEGRPLALFTKMMAHKSAEMGGKLKGMGQLPETASTTTVGSAPPAQQQMS